MNVRSLSLFLLLILLISCSAPSPASTPTQPPPTETELPQPTATQRASNILVGSNPWGYRLTEPGVDAENLWQSVFVPWWVRSSPDGRVLAVTDGGDSIFELKPDGTLEVVFQHPGAQIESFAAASDGALWFATRDGGRLYRADPDGEEVRLLADHGNRNLEAGLNGEVYAIENGLDRIEPDGTRTHISDEVNGRRLAIGPNGEIVSLTDGRVLLVSEDGTTTELASGYGPEPWLAFGPDGLLYVTHWMSVDVIDLASGSVSSIPWLQGQNLSEAGTFAPDGRLLLYHPNTYVFAVDLAAQTIETYHRVTSNTWAMAVNPDGVVYAAFGDRRTDGETTVFRVVDDQTLEPVLSVPYGMERAMDFDSTGTGYLAVGDPNAGAAIFSFDPSSGTFEEYARPECWTLSMSVDPQTDRVWWEECGHYSSLDEGGALTTIDEVPGTRHSFFTIAPDGTFYTIAFVERQDPNTAYEHRLYRREADGTAWEEVADLTQSDPAITVATLAACPDGHIYTVESLDADHVPVDYSSFNAVRRLEPDGTLTLLGYNFSYDGLAADCDPASGQVVFTSGAGIFALTPP